MKLTFHTAGYQNWSRVKVLDMRAVNIASRPHDIFFTLPADRQRHLPIFFPDRTVWTARNRGMDWRHYYSLQLRKAYIHGQLHAAVSRIRHGDILFCWEWNPDDCHRTIVRDTLLEKFGHLLEFGGDLKPEREIKPVICEPARPPRRLETNPEPMLF